MNKYVSKETVSATIEFFRSHDYKKPEQIGLFFYFKANGLNDLLYSVYEKWGNMPDSQRQANLRVLYDLAAAFDLKTETGTKRSAIFPFSITRDIKANAFYNGATKFTGLISRISDTLDNALVSTFIQRNTSVTNEIRLQNEYIELLKNDYLSGSTIPLELFAAWCFKFWKIELPDNLTDQDFKDICVLAFLEQYHISVKEFKNLFFFGNKLISSADQMITGKELRQAIKFSHDITPEVKDEPTANMLPFSKCLTMTDVERLLKDRGDSPLTAERIIEILSARDAIIQKEYDEMGVEDMMPEAQVETEPLLPDYDINQ